MHRERRRPQRTARAGAILVSEKARHETSFTAKVAKGRKGAFAMNIPAFRLGAPSSLSDLALYLHKLRAGEELNPTACYCLHAEYVAQNCPLPEDSLLIANAYVSAMPNSMISMSDRVFTQPLCALRVLRGKSASHASTNHNRTLRLRQKTK